MSKEIRIGGGDVMVKETVICIISFGIILFGNFTTQSYAKDSMDNIANQLEELRKVIEVEEVDENIAIDKMKEIFSNWEEKYKTLAYFIEHDELEKIETALTETKSNIEMKEYAEAVVRLDESVYILGHVEDKLAFELENIF